MVMVMMTKMLFKKKYREQEALLLLGHYGAS